MPAPIPPAPKPFVIVIPAYEEAATIAAVVAECRAAADVALVIVVDDGSRDATAALAEAAGARVLRQPANRGKGAALRRGLADAMADEIAGVITLDGDGQHRPADLPRLIADARAAPGALVIGSRRAAPGAPRARYAANRVADFWVSWAAGQPIDDSQSGFRIYPATLLARLGPPSALAQRFGFESDILIAAGWLDTPIRAVSIPAIYGPTLRRSHFRPVADIARIVAVVGLRLLRRGLHPVGFWRVVRKGSKARALPSTRRGP